MNYRHIHNAATNTDNMAYSPSSIGYQNISVFIQDDIALVADRLRLTLGAKEEKSYFGGMQFQPNARLLWTPDNINSVWLAASKASRTPYLNETVSSAIALSVTPPSAATGFLPVQAVISGNRNLAAEKVTSLEAGYRTQWSPNLSTDIAAFVNNYHNLSQAVFVNGVATPAFVLTPVMHLVVPMTFTNSTATTQTRGLEISADWRALDWMRLEGAYTYIRMNAPPFDGINTDSARLPRSQESLRCLMDLNEQTKLNLAVRHIGNLPTATASVPAYTAVDANMIYTPHKGLELSVVTQNLFGQHREVSNGLFDNQTSQIPRSIFAKITWSD
ncbi:MAG: TonB-dependent receptor [Gallionella sp.]|nr:TonB-dependent receptor [Gallionella sp.]